MFNQDSSDPQSSDPQSSSQNASSASNSSMISIDNYQNIPTTKPTEKKFNKFSQVLRYMLTSPRITKALMGGNIANMTQLLKASGQTAIKNVGALFVNHIIAVMNRILRQERIISTPMTDNERKLLMNLGPLPEQTRTLYLDMMVKAGGARNLEQIEKPFITGSKVNKQASSKMMSAKRQERQMGDNEISQSQEPQFNSGDRRDKNILQWLAQVRNMAHPQQIQGQEKQFYATQQDGRAKGSKGDIARIDAILASNQIGKNRDIEPVRKIMSDQATNKRSLVWAMIPNATFNQKQNRWFFQNGNGNMQTIKPPKQKDLTQVTKVFSKHVGTKLMIEQIQPALNAANAKLMRMGFAGPGAINQHSLTSYFGRYLDKKSGRIKTIGKPNYLYNRNNWTASYQHSLLQMAYKWNQFVSAVQRTVRLLQRKSGWDQQIKYKQKQLQPQNATKTQMLGIMNKIKQGIFQPYNVGTAQQQEAIRAAFRQWNYGALMKTIEGIATKYLATKGKDLDGLAKKHWQNWAKISQNAAKRSFKNQIMSTWDKDTALPVTKTNKALLLQGFANYAANKNRYQMKAAPFSMKKTRQGTSISYEKILQLLKNKKPGDMIIMEPQTKTRPKMNVEDDQLVEMSKQWEDEQTV